MNPYIVPCQFCGKETHRKNRNRYVCGGCYVGKYTRDFKKISKKMRENGRCFICGDDKRLHIHHLDENKKNNDPNNLEVRCNQCHASIHLKNEDPIGVRWGKFGKRLIYK